MWRTVARIVGRVCPRSIRKEVIALEEGSVANSEETRGEGDGGSERANAGSATVSAARTAGDEPPALQDVDGEGRPQDSGPSTQDDRGPGTGEDAHAPGAQDVRDPELELDRLRAELDAARARALASHRRALLAENAGLIVPELVMGSTAEELEGSLEVARRAFEAARAATLAEAASAPVPAGNPVRRGPSVEGMSPLEKIAYGLKRD